MKNNYPPPYIQPSDHIILFDGMCKFCDKWSRFVIRFDEHCQFKFCAVQSEKGQQILQWFGYPTDNFDTMLLVKGNRVLEKSDCFLAIISQLTFPWNCLKIFRLFPKKLRDWIYDRVALNRYKMFGKYESCALPTEENEKRFM